MSAQAILEEILAKLSPEHSRKSILAASACQGEADHITVSLTTVVNVLTQDRDLGTGSEGWRALIKLKRAVRDTLESVPGMRYVEGDS